MALLSPLLLAFKEGCMQQRAGPQCVRGLLCHPAVRYDWLQGVRAQDRGPGEDRLPVLLALPSGHSGYVQAGDASADCCVSSLQSGGLTHGRVAVMNLVQAQPLNWCWQKSHLPYAFAASTARLPFLSHLLLATKRWRCRPTSSISNSLCFFVSVFGSSARRP